MANQLAAPANPLAFKVISSPAIHAGALGLPDVVVRHSVEGRCELLVSGDQRP
jgi:hypothetical protein